MLRIWRMVMKIIELTQGRFTVVNDEDYALVSSSKWFCSARGYAVRSYKGKGLYLHRVLLGLVPGDGILVDHIDNDKLNNTRKNLRVCTHVENCRNRRKHLDNTSGFKGVFFMRDHERKRPWVARIGVNGKATHIGNYKTKEEAARAYDKAAKQHHGDFASLNFEETKMKLGRPKKYENPPIKMSIMLDKESRQRLEQDSKALGISMSEYIQSVIKRAKSRAVK